MVDPDATSDSDPTDIPDKLHEIKQLAYLREIAAGGAGAAILTAIRDAIIAQGTVTLSTEGTQLQVEANLDDSEQLARDIARLIGTKGADTGASSYNDTGLTVTAASGGDGTTTLTVSGGTTLNWEPVAKAGDTLRISGGPNPGDYEIASVDTLTIRIYASFAHVPTAGIGFAILDLVDAESVLGRLIALRDSIVNSNVEQLLRRGFGQDERVERGFSFNSPTDYATVDHVFVPGLTPDEFVFTGLTTPLADFFARGQEVTVKGGTVNDGTWTIVDLDTTTLYVHRVDADGNIVNMTNIVGNTSAIFVPVGYPSVLLELLASLKAIHESISGDVGASIPGTVFALGVSDPSNNAAVIDKSALGIEVDVKSAPTYEDVGASAYPTILKNSGGSNFGENGTPIFTKDPSPAKVTGQHVIAGVGAEVISAAQATKNGIVIVQAVSGNPNTVYVGYAGVTTSIGIELLPGQAIDMPADDADEIYVIDAVGGSANEVRFIVK